MALLGFGDRQLSTQKRFFGLPKQLVASQDRHILIAELVEPHYWDRVSIDIF